MLEEKYYTQEFYECINPGAVESAKVVVPLILDLIPCKSVVDVGCGNGAWLKTFKDYGISHVLGIDGNYIDKIKLSILPQEFMSLDLKQPIEIPEKFDLVLSLEVAEHLPSKYADKFIGSLVKLGPVVVFSAAVPLQGGENHVNEQWPNYWVDIFQKKGYLAFDNLREKIWDNKKVEVWYRQNVYLFIKEDYLNENKEIKSQLESRFFSGQNIVHPDMFVSNREEIIYLRKELKKNTDPKSASLKTIIVLGFLTIRYKIIALITKILIGFQVSKSN